MFKNIIERFFKCFKKEENNVEESLEKIIEILNFYRK
jgi:hypothetical protein